MPCDTAAKSFLCEGRCEHPWGAAPGAPRALRGFVGRGTHPQPLGTIQLRSYTLDLGIFFPSFPARSDFVIGPLYLKGRGGGRKELPPSTDGTAHNKYQSCVVSTGSEDGKGHPGDIGEQNNARQSPALRAGDRSAERSAGASHHRLGPPSHPHIPVLPAPGQQHPQHPLVAAGKVGGTRGWEAPPPYQCHTRWWRGEMGLEIPKMDCGEVTHQAAKEEGCGESWSCAWNGRVTTVPPAAAFPAEVSPLDIAVQRCLPRSFCRDWQRGSPCIPSSLPQHKPGPNSTFQQINGHHCGGDVFGNVHFKHKALKLGSLLLTFDLSQDQSPEPFS